jgi:hypothetical protein
MSAARTGLGGGAATLALARLALVRALRGKALWVAAVLVVFPVIIAATRTSLGHPPDHIWRAVFTFALLALPIVPSILVAPSLADELDDKTCAYLWSRALPRWSIVAGKLLGLAPIAMLLMMASLAIAWGVMGGPGKVPVDLAVRGIVALGAAALVASTIAAALALLVPRHGVAIAIVYLLMDAALGALPLKLKAMTVFHSAHVIAGFEDTGLAGSLITLGVIGALTSVLAIRRITRMES